MCKRCGRENCTGYYLLHPAEMIHIPEIEAKEREKNQKCRFDLTESPSSGEIFTKFHELHVLVD